MQIQAYVTHRGNLLMALIGDKTASVHAISNKSYTSKQGVYQKTGGVEDRRICK